jgi:predicted Zn-dependent peptidase
MQAAVSFSVILALLAVSGGGSPALSREEGRPFPEYRHTLPNGLKILVLPQAGVDDVCLALVVPAGTVFEAGARRGVARVVAQMAGSGRTGPQDPLDVTVDRLRTIFHRCGPSADLPRLVEDMARVTDWPTDLPDLPTLPENADGETARRTALGALHERCFPGHPLGQSLDVATTPTSADLRYFYQRHYSPFGSWLLVAGSVDPFEAARLVAGAFRAWPVSPRGDLPELPPAPASPEPTARLRHPGTGAMALVGGRLNGVEPDRRRAAARILLELAGDHLKASHQDMDLIGPLYLPSGLWALGARSSTAGEAKRVLRTVMAILDRLAAGDVEGEAVDAVRNRLLDRRRSDPGDDPAPAGQPEEMLRLLLESPALPGSSPGLLHETSALEALDLAALRRLAADLLASDARVAVLVGPERR